MRVDDFDFDLPDALIALEPACPRDAARLLHVHRAGLKDHQVSELPDLLRSGDLLVVNDTRVLPAQLTGIRPARAIGGGGDVTIDVTLHQQVSGVDTKNAKWRAFVRPAKRVTEGDEINFGEGVCAVVEERAGAQAQLAFNVLDADFEAALERIGAPPLPPYIARRRPVNDQDKERYQTIYANEAGSVAAPTAGLHFTDGLLERLADRGVDMAALTLHVGAGTFLPVTAEDTTDHKMHAEWGELSTNVAARINETKASGGRIIAVGTTSLRLLESAAGPNGLVEPFLGETDIFITPGYDFQIADALMTNFHLPRSTLFMLVSAFAGTTEMKAAYAHAINKMYRFYSYGDACLIERKGRV